MSVRVDQDALVIASPPAASTRVRGNQVDLMVGGKSLTALTQTRSNQTALLLLAPAFRGEIVFIGT